MVTGKRREALVAALTAGAHQIIADVSKELGGTDLGPGPHEILEAALAACTIITVQMYANRHQWNLESTNVKVAVDKEGAESHLTREISFIGDLTEVQKSKLAEIAEKCPIHKLLTSHITISTRVLP